jgi:hypothetical protein
MSASHSPNGTFENSPLSLWALVSTQIETYSRNHEKTHTKCQSKWIVHEILTQRRKGAKKRTAELCAFAPLREAVLDFS